MKENINKLKNELKILKNDLVQFFTDTGEDINDDFYNKLIEFSSKNPEMLSVLKLLTVLSSKNETELKQHKIKTYKILEKIINMKDESLNVLEIQHELINEIKEMLDNLKAEKEKSLKKVNFTTLLNIILKSKILTGVFSITILIILFYVIKHIDYEMYNDVIKYIVQHLSKFW